MKSNRIFLVKIPGLCDENLLLVSYFFVWKFISRKLSNLCGSGVYLDYNFVKAFVRKEISSSEFFKDKCLGEDFYNSHELWPKERHPNLTQRVPYFTLFFFFSFGSLVFSTGNYLRLVMTEPSFLKWTTWLVLELQQWHIWTSTTILQQWHHSQTRIFYRIFAAV